MIPSLKELFSILPIIIVGAGILVSLIIEMFLKPFRKLIPFVSFVIFIAVAYISILEIGNVSYSYSTMLNSGGLTNLFFFLINFGASIVVLISVDYIRKKDIFSAEYYVLLQSAVLGMMIMVAAKDLLMVFLGLEQMSICFYILAGINRRNLLSNESSLKYFLLGSFATGFIVYGMAIVYGSAGSLFFTQVFNVLLNGGNTLFLSVGLLLLVVGFSFKIAAFPFHQWVPDVYQGSPTVVTALMSTLGKSAAFSVLIVLLLPIASSFSGKSLMLLLSILSALSMIYGSIVALSQKDIKRMLAYSSIAHAGYMLVGVVSGIEQGSAGVVFYLFAYTFMNLAAFGIVSYIEGNSDSNLSINDYIGLSSQKPFLAALLALIMFALAGIPPLAGFFGKYYVFIAAIKSGFLWLALIGIVSSIISVYFYLRIVVYMYFKNQTKLLTVFDSNYSLLGIVIASLLVVVIGIFPNSIIELITLFLN